jgi:hypothetical protein
MEELLRNISNPKKDYLRTKLLKFLLNWDQLFSYLIERKYYIEIWNLVISYFIMVLLKLQILVFVRSYWQLSSHKRWLVLLYIWHLKYSKELFMIIELIYGHLELYCMKCCMDFALISKARLVNWLALLIILY